MRVLQGAVIGEAGQRSSSRRRGSGCPTLRLRDQSGAVLGGGLRGARGFAVVLFAAVLVAAAAGLSCVPAVLAPGPPVPAVAAPDPPVPPVAAPALPAPALLAPPRPPPVAPPAVAPPAVAPPP